jgi:hypothetical protein
VISGVAVVPAAALATSQASALGSSPDTELLAMEPIVDALWDQLNATCEVLGRADSAMFEWRRHNPPPEMPEVKQPLTLR